MADTPWTPSAAWPLVLLPVRVEVRFAPPQLLLRVFPDDLHIDTHERDLTADEIRAGKRYWEAVWRAGPAAEREEVAWDELTAGFGPERAVWIARVLEPRNPTARPKQAVPPPTPLSPAPTFPTLTPAKAAWTRPPLARALPSRWRVVGWAAGPTPTRFELTSSTAVTRPLPAGPSPAFDPSALGQDVPPVDAAAAWLVDFAAAEAAGMALRVALPPEALQHGIARLLVFGVDEAMDATQGGQALTDLLEAHHHTRGLAYIPLGTPTNNTATAASGYSLRDPARRTAMRVRHGDAPPASPDAAARVLAGALGVPLTTPQGAPAPAGSPSGLARARNAARAEQAESRAMSTALWPATFGYFLWQMAGGRFDDATIRRGRRHFVDHVRAGGPLPALRVGDQPYGVLPVQAFARWTARDGEVGGGLGPDFAGFLRRLRTGVWEPSASGVPRVVASATDAHARLARIFGMAPVAQQLAARSALGADYVTWLWRFIDDFELEETWQQQLRDAARALSQRLGLGDWDPRGGRLLFASDAYRVRAPLVQATPRRRAPGQPPQVLTPPSTYLRTIMQTAAADLVARIDEGDPADTPLLYRLLRHSALVEHAVAAWRILHRESGASPPGDHAEPELVDILPGPATPTFARRLGQDITSPSGTPAKLGDYLKSPEQGDAATSDLLELRAALESLAGVDVASLERLLAETIDLTSHRLDAWITSYASRRLAWMRGRPPVPGTDPSLGAYVGAFGWLHDVTPRQAPERVDPAPAGEADTARPLVRAPDNAGFVHAPSLAQATTAAILRAAHHSVPPAGPVNPLAVDLTSARVRTATGLLDGIRQGQPLGALLGYRIERDLQESPVPGMARFISRLRALAPVRGTRVAPDAPATEAVAATDVVDGLALHRMRAAGELDIDRDLGPVAQVERGALTAVLASLDDAVDALGDALLVEGVHHAALGNPTRAGATLDAAARGDVPPPELEFTRTPRTGTAVTHRLLVLLTETTADRAVWPVDAVLQARAAAEPRLDAWAARLLPAPGRVRCAVEIRGGALADRDRFEITLAPLRLSALDYVFMSERGGEAGSGELELRLLDYVRSLPGVGPAAEVRLDFGRGAGWPATAVSVAELLELAQAVRRLIGSARAARPADLDLPDRTTAPAATDAALTARANAAAAALAAAAGDLAPARDLPTVRAALVRAAHLGLPGAYPAAPLDGGEAVLRAQAAAVKADADRHTAAIAALTRDRQAGVIGDLDHDLGRMREVFGPDFRVLPAFAAPQAADLTRALGASTALQNGDAAAATGWVTRVARVRAGTDRLVGALHYAEAFGTGDALTLEVAQLPYADGDGWLALNLGGRRPAGSRLSLVVHTPGGGAAGKLAAPVAGLAVDDWVEVIPNARELTGVAFHFDTPGACAPQAILVAVPPDARATWDMELVEATIGEALAMAQLRLVDLEALHPLADQPDVLTDIGQFLPAALLATNVTAEAVATDLTRGADG